ncbi:hypothetical protein PoHVEF18_010279 [Penicillium ochrochloron]
MSEIERLPRRPTSRDAFEIAVICALTLEADAVDALLDYHWDDDGPPYDKAPNDPNAYSTGAIGRHNVVLAYMPGTGKASAAAVTAKCHTSFPNIKLAIVVGVCGAVPFSRDGREIVLGDVIISDGIVQYDFRRQLPGRSVQKDSLLDSLGRPNAEIRSLLAKLKSIRNRKALQEMMSGYLDTLQTEPELAAGYPGMARDKLFEATYHHISDGEKDIVAFEMEGAGVWDNFPCVVIKGVCDYADSHKSKEWQPYAAATAAACMKAFLYNWVPSLLLHSNPVPEEPAGPWCKNLTLRARRYRIALEYVHWLKETCTDMSVFWVHGSTVERFRQSYTTIALECRIHGYDDARVDVLPLVKNWLERKDQGPWVMVIDNADDTQLFFPPPEEPKNASSGTQEESLGQYIPECAHGSILITTRNKQAGLNITKGKPPIEIGTMSEDESERLLRASLGKWNIDSGELLKLSHRLEQLPLALVPAAAFIEANTIAVSDYLHLLDRSDQDLVALLSEEFETVGRDLKTPRAVAETWMLSFAQIQQQDAFASELFSLMSFFDRQAIPMEFLEYYNEQQGQEKRGEIQLQKSLGILKAFSFVTTEQDQSLNVHRLVQLVSRNAASYLFYQGQWKDAEKLQLEALEVRRDRLESENHSTLTTMNNLALTYSKQGRWEEAEKLEVQVIKTRKTQLGADHPSTLMTMNNLASTYSDQGRWEEAEKLFVQVMENFKAKHGANDPSTLTSMGNLAWAYSHLGRWEEAEKLEVQVMETRKTQLGAHHPDTLTSMGNLASTYRQEGRWEEAEKLEVQVMETRKTQLGAHHPHTLTSMHNLAMGYLNQGRWEEAEKLFVQVSETRKAKLGAYHPDTLRSMAFLALTNMAILASTLLKQGRWEEATKLLVQVKETSKSKFRTDHLDTLTSIRNMASTYSNLGWWEEAEKLEVMVMETSKAKLGADHPDTLTSMNDLAFTWKYMGRHEDALTLMDTCFNLRRRVLGHCHPVTRSTLQALLEWRREELRKQHGTRAKEKSGSGIL